MLHMQPGFDTVADFSGVESETLTIAASIGEMVFSGGARELLSPAVWPCTASPLPEFPARTLRW